MTFYANQEGNIYTVLIVFSFLCNLFFFVYRLIIVGFPDKTKPQTTPVNGQAILYQRKKKLTATYT